MTRRAWTILVIGVVVAFVLTAPDMRAFGFVASGVTSFYIGARYSALRWPR